jgi:hypothetical protein
VKALTAIEVEIDFGGEKNKQIQIQDRFPDTSFQDTGFLSGDQHLGS